MFPSQPRSTRRSDGTESQRLLLVGLIITITATSLLLLPAVLGADDANSNDLSLSGRNSSQTCPTTTIPASGQTLPGTNITFQITCPPPDPQNLSDQSSLIIALQGLNGNVNDSDIQRLVVALQQGNVTNAKAILQEIKVKLQDPSSPTSQKMTETLKKVVQSAKCTETMCGIDWKQLHDDIRPDRTDQNGVPDTLKGMNSTTVANDLNKLGDISKTQNPSLSDQLYHDANQIRQSLEQARNNKFKDPSSGDPPQTSRNANPSVPTPPSIPPTGGSGIMLPSTLGLPPALSFLTMLVFPVAAILMFKALGRAGGTVRLSKGKKAGPLIGTSTRPRELDPHNPRNAIVLCYRSVVGLMFSKGVMKADHETHREFSAKCQGSPEYEHIGGVAGLYEKAVFSGREASEADAQQAREHVARIERTVRSSGRPSSTTDGSAVSP